MHGHRRRWRSAGLLSALVIGAIQLVSAPAVAAPPTTAAAARILYYDASRAAEFVSVVHQGANNWNAALSNVQLRPVPAGVRANITVIADNGWPRAQTTSLGNGRWYMGRQAVRDGHYTPRISTHEFGHLLGLPDRRTGRCTDLMSGASAGTSCRNPLPNAAEAAEANANFAPRAAVSTKAAARSYTWEGSGTSVDQSALSPVGAPARS
ncbi:MAG TPA: snapalysin family zinc-dependent metalloprotease [Catenuloplanes sp.]|jgi:snapalysin